MSSTAPRTRRSTVLPGAMRSMRQRSCASGTMPWAGSDERSARHEADVHRVASYLDGEGRRRELVVYPGAAGSRLVVDRDGFTRADRHLIAHLAREEPAQNAELVCALYLQDPLGARCRRLATHDLHRTVPSELEAQASVAEADLATVAIAAKEGVCDGAGNRYRLVPVEAKISIPELRWYREAASEDGEDRPLSVRQAIGAIESYEPVRSLTAAAVRRHRDDSELSVSTIAAELERLASSAIVLNRGLREAVLAAVQAGRMSMSEIALRCGRVKRDRKGGISGETTWLARRIGVTREGGAAAPSPWVHSDVLALIARRGLDIAPREVELG